MDRPIELRRATQNTQMISTPYLYLES